MPGLNGLETASRIRETDMDVQIAFISCLNDHMGQAFNVLAFGFLVKPLTAGMLFPLLDRFDAFRKRRTGNLYGVHLAEGGTAVLKLDEVMYLESRLKHILAHTANGRVFYCGTISSEEAALPERGFIRVHRSYLVNVSHIWVIGYDHLTLKTGVRLPVGRSYVQTLREKLHKKRKERFC